MRDQGRILNAQLPIAVGRLSSRDSREEPLLTLFAPAFVGGLVPFGSNNVKNGTSAARGPFPHFGKNRGKLEFRITGWALR